VEDEGWDKTYKWNKYKDYCNYSDDDYYWITTYHSSSTTDYIALVSSDGFKNTGLKNGENHLKCYYTSGTYQANEDLKATEWKPDFSSDEGESIV